MATFSVLLLTAPPPGIEKTGGNGAFVKVDGRESLLKAAELFLNRDPVKQIQVVISAEQVEEAKRKYGGHFGFSGIKIITETIAAGRTLRGFEVDYAVRGHIVKRGFAEYFTHRTGHSIGRETHGNGANMDNFESHDERRVIPWTCFSIEPGIYLPEFGVRSEINMFIGEGEARVTGEIQQELVLL